MKYQQPRIKLGTPLTYKKKRYDVFAISHKGVVLTTGHKQITISLRQAERLVK